MNWHWTKPRFSPWGSAPITPWRLREATVYLDQDKLWSVTLHFDLGNHFDVWFVTMTDPDTGREIEVTEAVYPQRDAEFDQYLWDMWIDLVDDYD